MLNTRTVTSLIAVTFLTTLTLEGCNVPDQAQSNNKSNAKLSAAAATKGNGKFKALISTTAATGQWAQITKAEIPITGVDVRSVDGAFLKYEISPAETVDLLQIRSGMGLPFIRGLIPQGQYDLIRLKTAPLGQLSFADGSTTPFDIPSGEQSGLKIFFDSPLSVTERSLSVIVVETDLMQSFVFTGSGQVHFHPVLRATALDPVVLPAPDPSPSPDTTAPASDGSGTDPVASPTPDSGTTGTGTTGTDPTASPTPDPTATSDTGTTGTGTTDPTADQVPVDGSGSVVSPPDYIDPNFSPWVIGV